MLVRDEVERSVASAQLSGVQQRKVKQHAYKTEEYERKLIIIHTYILLSINTHII